jgi:nucleotide-binding universal stress UspA family protein
VGVVVVGVDGSRQSQEALDWALAHAAERGSTVEAIMTVSPGELSPDDLAAVLAEADLRLATYVADALGRAAATPAVAQTTVAGDPAVVLVNASRTAELVVLGSHGMSSISNPVLGSVSLACIRLGSCPVLVIPPGRPEAVLDETVQRRD